MLLFVWACVVSSVSAGSYHDFLCEIPYGPNAGSPVPTVDVGYSTNGIFSQGGSSCERPNGEMVTRMDGEVEHPADGAGEYATFTAPNGLSIAGFTLWRYEQIGNTQAYGPPVASIDYGNSSGFTTVDSCVWIAGCSANGSQSSHLFDANIVQARNLGGITYIQWSAICADTGGTCPTGPNTEEDVYAADIDLADDTPPTVSGVDGPLVGGGTLTGKQTVSFDATDGQSGVYGGSLLVDGHTEVSQVLDTNGGACQSLGITTDGQRSFEYAQPCPATVSSALTLDTSRLTPGSHSLEVIVEDAAGNQTIAYNGTITVPGPPPTDGTIGPGSPAALRGAPNGTNASDQAKLTAHWNGTASVTRTSRYGQADRITGRLSTPNGQPISGALLDVSETPAYEGAKTVSFSGARTEPDGDWVLVLPRSVSSSTLRFAYRSHVNDTVAVARASLALRVHAGIALRIAPRVTRVGQRIVFTGVLHGMPVPLGGKQLVLEANSGGGWVEFDTITTRANGRYRATYRFRFPGPVAYRFRVFSPYEADFPFLDGVSNVVRVLER